MPPLSTPVTPPAATHVPDRTEPQTGLHPRDWIAGLERGLAILEAFGEDRTRLTAQQAGEHCGLTRTAARRYLLTLAHLGYVGHDGKYYWLTPRVMRLGQSYLASARLPRQVQPYLQRITTVTNEIAYLAVLDGDDVVYVARKGPNRAMNSGYVLGARVPGHVTAAGMLMLSCLKPEQLEAWLVSHTLPAYTPYTVTDPQVLRQMLRQVREQGWAHSEQQFDLGHRGVAVALRDLKGEMLGALSVVMPFQHESGEEAVRRVLPALRDAAQAMRSVV